MKFLLTFHHTVTGNPATTLLQHNAVPMEDVEWLAEFIDDNNTTFEQAIHILRRTHYPFHHNPHPWCNGK